MCGPICICFTGSGRWAGSSEIPPIGDRCKSAFEDQGKSTQLKTSHLWKMLFKRRVWISLGHSFSRFHSCTVLFMLSLFTCNKLFNFTGLENSIWTYHFCMRLCEVTQRITTSVIPLEASISANQKGPHIGGESSLGSSAVLVIRSVATLCTPTKNKKKVGKKFSNKLSSELHTRQLILFI